VRSRVARAAAAFAVCGVLLTAAACGDDGDDEAGAAGASAADTVACGATAPPPADPATYDAPPDVTIDLDATYTAVLETSCGEIRIALDPDAAPMAVNNFVFLAREGFYDGLTFHRVVPGFVIQGGDPNGDGTGGPGYTFPDELPTGEGAYPPGAVAMANSGPDTNGSQFFIVTGDAPLPPAYTRFGEVTEGLEVAREIEALADPDAAPGDPSAQVPSDPAYIDSVTIEEF
jgi:cyclophilin family peptidyl-prolyl cis-trans isomerase